MLFYTLNTSNLCCTVVPALDDHGLERPPAVYGHVINVPTNSSKVNLRLPVIRGHRPNADSHLLVVLSCYRLHLILCYICMNIAVPVVIVVDGHARCIIFGVPRLPTRPSDERPPVM